MHRLYVIGNGFDLHHGIPSAYRDFGEYLKSHDARTYALVETYLAFDSDFWFDFETRLADFDADSLLDHASDFLVPYSAEKWSDSYHHDYQYEIAEVVTALSTKLKTAFSAWIGQLPIPPCPASKLLKVDREAKLLNFNYTPTLTDLYHVSSDLITHIHGLRGNSEDTLVLGHGWKPTEKHQQKVAEDYEQDTRVAQGDTLIRQYFQSTYKNTDDVILRHQAFFASLGSIQEIFVLGHSMADVDLPYFHEIAQHLNSSATAWTVSYYGDNSKVAVQFAKLRLACPIRYLRLNEIELA